jgi:Fibronectin type III domain
MRLLHRITRLGGALLAGVLVASFSGTTVAQAAPPPTAPSAPTGLSTVVGSTSVTLTWSPPDSVGSSPINYYLATSVPPTSQCYAVVSLGDPTTCTFSNLVQGTGYTFSVTATGTNGLVGPAATVGPVTPQAAPAAPTGINAVVDGSSLAVSWIAPTVTGGSALTSSTATATSPSGSVISSCTALSPATSCVISGLEIGGSYQVAVTATNAAGLTSQPSNPSSLVTLATTPAPPSNVTVVGAESSVVASWDPSSTDGGRPITSYTATALDVHDASVGTCSAQPTTTGRPSCTIRPLANGSAVTVVVTAVNSMGSSQPSVASAPVAPEIGDASSFDELIGRLIAHSKIDLSATGATYSVALPPTTRVLGISVHGDMSVHVNQDGTSTWKAAATLPEIFGGTTATLSAVVVNQQVVALRVGGSHASIAGLFTVDRVHLTYGVDGWQLDGVASVPSGQDSSLSGSLTVSPSGAVTAGAVHLGGLSLAGIVDLSSFDLTFDAVSGWQGSATFANLLTGQPNGSGAAVHLGFSAAGQLTSGSIDANGPVSIFGVIELKRFRLSLDPHGQRWDAAITASLPSTTGGLTKPGKTSFALGVENGAITGASFALENVSFAGVMTLDAASFAYKATDGHEDFNVATAVTLPGQTGAAIAGHLHMADGLYRSGSIVGSHLSVHLVSGVYLQAIGVAIDAPTPSTNWRIAGTMAISYGPSVAARSLVEVQGGLSYTFPTSGGVLGTYDLTGSLAVGGVTLGSAQLLVSDNPVVSLRLVLGPGDGSEGLSLGSYAQATGVLEGTITSSSFVLSGTAAVTFAGSQITSTIYIDARGAAFCAEVPVLGRGGVTWIWGSAPTLVGATCSTAGF